MTDKEDCFKQVQALAGKFLRNREHYESPDFNEQSTRLEFINPLFEALGWDIGNNKQNSPDYQEVVLEKADSNKKRPDYTFRVGEKPMFYVEAKKPGVHISKGKEGSQASYQLRRYAWNSKLALSIVTNFKEIIVYDCTKKPEEQEKVSPLCYLKTENFSASSSLLGDDFHKEFDFLWDTFARDNVWGGNLDRYTQTGIDSKGIVTVDDDFLHRLEGWRRKLADDIYRNNKHLTEKELNFAVQQTLDRIVFLRIAEDREIEPDNSVAKAVDTYENRGSYRQLFCLFERADEKYNSGLFNFEADTISQSLSISNNIIKEIVNALYRYYDFSVIPIEILGSAYERFLGKTVIITPDKTAAVIEKPEVRKAGGVFYTPQYIVEYIVKNTLGTQLEGKTAKEAAQIKIVDPACGSGSFLVGAYQFLLRWYQKHYADRGASKGRSNDPITPDGLLTIEERKRILLNNIYGTDIDATAVEVTKLSLLLECMKGVTTATVNRLKSMNERVLPNIDGNIRCGNSLVGNDVYLQDRAAFSEEEKYKINAFDWRQEFKDVFKSGGFGIVISNPPYGAALTAAERDYLERQFNIGNTDTAALFLLQAQKLLHATGKSGVIIPKAFTYASNWQKVRQALLNDIENVADCGRVWNKVKLEMCIGIFQKENRQKYFTYSSRTGKDIDLLGKQRRSLCTEFDLILNGISEQEIAIALKVKHNNNDKVLNDFIENRRGGMLQGEISESGSIRVLSGKQVRRYYLETDKIKGRIYKGRVTDEKSRIADNAVFVQNIVAHIARPAPHIKIIACLNDADKEKFVILDTINQLTVKTNLSPVFVLAIINSRLVSWYGYHFVYAHAIRTMHFDSTATAKIPFPDINLSRKADKQVHNRIVDLVGRLMDLKKKEKDANEMRSWNVFHRQIESIDGEIDRLVYRLYGLTDAEIKIIEKDAKV
ncbi:MAG: N-6 DNA methylase [Planctomycetaceae bacterium]|jgi:type I restriction-modification system DNA methylase subunit|nr:N-6 DNA methylase [Planctomycetaceae bacterium]